MPKKKATKKKLCCPTCGGEMTPPVFELPEEERYSIFVFQGDDWGFVDRSDCEEDAVEIAALPGNLSEWIVVYSNRTGKVVWGPEWVPGEDE